MALLVALHALLALRTEPEEGQGMVEYGLIIAAVAIAVIIAIFALGPKIVSMFSSAGASLGACLKSLSRGEYRPTGGHEGCGRL